MKCLGRMQRVDPLDDALHGDDAFATVGITRVLGEYGCRRVVLGCGRSTSRLEYISFPAVLECVLTRGESGPAIESTTVHVASETMSDPRHDLSY